MRRYRYALYFLAALALYVLSNSFILPLAARHTGLCGGCHAPSKAYQSAARSKHKDIGCLACHQGPGIGGAFDLTFRAWRNLLETFKNNGPTERRVDNDACFTCHDKLIDDITRSRGIKMSHREVIDAGWRCAECHGQTGHELGEPKARLQEPSMDKCFGCHLSGRKLRECDLCHFGPVPRKAPTNPQKIGLAAHTKNWREKNHGTPDNKFCSVCHRSDFCRRCHQVTVPHPPETWVYQHSLAAIIKPKACRDCHKTTFCSDCHQVAMPHPKDYQRTHMRGEFDEAVCERCHFVAECAACHRAHQVHKKGGPS